MTNNFCLDLTVIFFNIVNKLHAQCPQNYDRNLWVTYPFLAWNLTCRQHWKTLQTQGESTILIFIYHWFPTFLCVSKVNKRETCPITFEWLSECFKGKELSWNKPRESILQFNLATAAVVECFNRSRQLRKRESAYKRNGTL